MSTSTDTELVALWRFETRSRVSEAVLVEYERYVHTFRRWLSEMAESAESDTPVLRDATALDLKRFVLVHSDRWSPGTLAMCRRGLRSFYAWLHNERLIDVNPALAIPAIKVPEVAVRVADTATRDALVAACLTVRDVALVEVIFGTGARRGEVLNLTVSDVSIGDRAVHIRKSKSGKPRTAPLDPRATAALADWLIERARIDASTLGDALWVKPDGSPLTPDGAKTIMRRLSTRSGVTFSTHDARRGYATRWLEAGGSETGLQGVCGWSSNAMVARYTRMSREKLAHDEARRLWG